MEKNVCGVDRAIRILVGLALLALALRGTGDGRTVSRTRILAGYGAAEFLLVNGTLQWCPLNYAFGLNTCVRDWPERIDAVTDPDERSGARLLLSLQ